ncbi:MAG: hypothetical protein AVDCRST_MAG66-1734, partial [uncultured Pseudonocardia sp.]
WTGWGRDRRDPGDAARRPAGTGLDPEHLVCRSARSSTGPRPSARERPSDGHLILEERH